MKVYAVKQLFSVILAGFVAIALGPARAQPARIPARVYSAGSLVVPLKQAIRAAGLDTPDIADPTFGPSGGLRERIEKGEAADLYLSANMEHPRTLAGQRSKTLVIPFARNNLCLISRDAVGLTQANAIDKMLDPNFRLATSTPGVDPGGDYAFAVFKRAENVRAGAEAALSQKALQLIGSPTAMAPIDGHTPAASIFLADRADILLSYCSGDEQVMSEVPGLEVSRLPPEIDVVATYGLALLTDNPAAARLALFLLSDKGQDILAGNGLVRIVPGEP
jgi:molybdate transport system substrate-binding protein